MQTAAGDSQQNHTERPRINNPRIVIVGAGPTGLGASWRLRELGHTNFVVYERESFPGGLATSFVDDNGFTWDIGGHVLHSHYPYFDRVFDSVMQGEFFTHRRESWIWTQDRFVPYPFQNNIHRLPPNVMHECLEGLRNRSHIDEQELRSLADWILASFGRGIAEHFLLPYNRKVWAYPPEEMSWQWVGDRVAQVDISRVEANIKENKDDVAWGPNATFHFPKHGGTGIIWRRVAARLADHIKYRSTVFKIDASQRRIWLQDGSCDSYDLLLTTMPLDILASLILGAELKPAGLHYSSVSVVGLGIRGQTPDNLRTKCWIYFPDGTVPFFRATIFSNYSRHNAPDGTWSLMTETASSAYRPLPLENIISATLDGARKVGVISNGDRVVSTWLYQTDRGYPTPTLGRDTYLTSALAALEQLGIYSRGRFGAWKYEVSNQDHTFMQGTEWVNRVLLGEAEVTLNHPNLVNRR